MSESEGTEVTRRRRRRRQGSSPAAQASLPDDDDLLREILVRLPPQPSSLPLASAVCKRWRRLVTDTKFHRQFCAHHRKPPLLGVFECRQFRSILDPPDRIPSKRFDLWHRTRRRADVLGCRHGRVLLLESQRHKVIVCDPITGEHHHIKAPAIFRGLYINGDVLCAAADRGHVHGNCHSSPFKVVLMSLYNHKNNIPPVACVYSSETGEWGDLISTTDRCELCETNPGILVGNVLYWSSKSASPGVCLNILDVEGFTDDIMEFDLDRQSLAVTKGPPSLSGSLRHQIIRTEDGALGLAILSYGRFAMCQRKASCGGCATWLLQKTVETHIVLGLSPPVEGSPGRLKILGYDEDNGAIFVHLGSNIYTVELMSMRSRKVYESVYAINCHPFTSFYAPARGCDGANVARLSGLMCESAERIQ